jgi:hypothetical protein
MGRELFVSALWWIGVVWLVVGTFAFAYAFIVDSPPETFLRDIGFSAGILILPGIGAMVVSMLLESRTE